ncbi:hypothetical protein PUNSTDRAFT_134928 [Punctularia strigosozonata HHB-11173 SS5]|uniref:uncharacterized protein n=1 Tax=Punctularia strigosozonata (strain HHB-11173) TaxID=741275 RepID=UPI00044186D9|nr:uncharacterized protein PUNSTDRAFT_134928 [Punctularia strigosozonata HHB-11173 SS5]EIN08549.1 hypothetical protein PUNSTDRAFT_134928 [Punctularia strigosozonata HHB-11173 SS5]
MSPQPSGIRTSEESEEAFKFAYDHFTPLLIVDSFVFGVASISIILWVYWTA